MKMRLGLDIRQTCKLPGSGVSHAFKKRLEPRAEYSFWLPPSQPALKCLQGIISTRHRSAVRLKLQFGPPTATPDRTF